MSNSETLIALAERVEAATGADRELDALIAALQIKAIEKTRFKTIKRWAEEAMRERWAFPHFTGSLDVAASLVPAGSMYRSGHDGTGPDPSLFFCEVITDAPECLRVRAVAATEPLARVAAFLRALAQGQTDE